MGATVLSAVGVLHRQRCHDRVGRMLAFGCRGAPRVGFGRQGALPIWGRRLDLKSRQLKGLNKISMDKIFLHALKTEAIIGIFDWERQVKQAVIVDLEMGADVRKAALTDSIDDTLNYKRIAKRVLAFIEASQYHLVETL